MISAHTVFAGVIGWPVHHSLSPLIHNYWCEKYRVDAAYLPLPVMPESLQKVLPALGLMGCKGVNLTLPHKELVLPMLDEMDATAKKIGAVNTVLFHEGKKIGYNTDAYGYWQSVIEAAPEVQTKKALVVGAGGAARAIIYALDQAGFDVIYLMNRTREKAEMLQVLSPKITIVDWAFNPPVLQEVDLVVNSSSLGMKHQPTLELNLALCKKHTVVSDIVYAPLETPLLAAAKKCGLQIVDGLGMLLYQAQKAFEIWFGVLPEVDTALRQLLLEHKKPELEK